MSARKGPVNVDDKENIDRFLKQMMRKNYEAAFTSSSSSIPPTTPGNTLQSGGSLPVSQPAHTKPQDTTVQGDGPSEATTPPNVQSAKIDKPQEQSALPPPPASTSSADTPVANQPGVNPNLTVNNTMRRSRGVSLNAGPNDTPASHQLPQWMEENCPPCQLSPTRTGAPHGLVDRFLQSPQMSGVQAPPPTPQTGPVSQHEITDIIHGAFDELQNAHPPAFTLGDSRYAPRRKSLLGQNRSDIRRSLEREGYTPFVTPNRELSAEDRRMRDEAFERLRSQLSPQQGKLATTASVTVGGDGKNRIECLQLASPSKAGRPPHLRPYNPSPGINKDNIKPTLHVPISVSAPETAVGLTAPDFSQTAYRFDSSSEQDPDQQISKFQALKIGGQSTSTAKPTISGETASPFSLHSSANLNSTRGDWMPPHLRPFTEEPVDKGSYQDGGGRSVVKKHDGIAPDNSAKREDGYSVAKATNTSESSSHNHEAPLPHFHMRKPAITFTAETRNIAPDHEEPDSSLVNSDGHSSWQPGQAKSNFLAATSTPMDQATYTPAGSSTGSRTPPRFRPREEFAGSIAQRSRDNPHVKSAYSKESLKHGRPLKNNPVGATATTSSSVFAHGTSKVPLTVAMVDNSLSSLGDIFAPIPSAKLPTAVNSTHPLSALDNPFNETVSTPRSALETGVTTPSSMTFSAVSPATAAAAGITAAIREANEQPDLEDVLFFKSWPKSDGDRRPGKPLLSCLYKMCVLWHRISSRGLSVVLSVKITDVLYCREADV